MKTTCVIILTYNNSSDTLNCIESVLNYNSAPIKLVVVDNGSNTMEAVNDLKAGLYHLFKDNLTVLNESDCAFSGSLAKATLLLSASNDGYASGNNKGLRLAFQDDEIDTLLILNNDILFVEDIIPKLRNDLEAKPDAAIVSPVLYKKDLVKIDNNCARCTVSVNDLILMHFPFPKDPFGVARRKQMPVPSSPGLFQIEMPSGSCMMVRKDLFEKIGGFDPNTFLYYEENILAEKIRRAGYKIYLDTEMRCIHLGATSTKKTQSKFIVGCSLDSMNYFVSTYKSPNALQRIVLSAFSRMIMWRLSVTGFVKGLIGK